MKIFDDEVTGNNRRTSKIISYVFYSVLIVLLIYVSTITAIDIHTINNKMENKKLAEIVVMDNDYILTAEVKYETSKKIDNTDTSGVFFEVINNNGYEKLPIGSLVKFPYQYRQLTQIEGVSYTIIDPKLIQFHIKPEDVKADILKR